GVVVRITTERGEITVETEDKSLELTVRKGGKIVRLHDTRTGQTWNLDTENCQLAVADEPGGLSIALPEREPLILHRQDGGKVTVRWGPVNQPSPIATAPTAEELAQRENAADALKPDDMHASARTYVGGGDTKKAPQDLVAVLG